MIAEAKAKLQAEMDASKGDDYVVWVGQHLLDHLDANPQDAEKFLAEGKTIAKSMDEVRKAAEKNRKGNSGFVNPDKGREIILGYFGIQANASSHSAVMVAPVVAPAAPVATSGSGFNVSLDEFGL